MQFCSECHNMYYLKIQDEDGVIGNTLIYYCRNCGHEDNTMNTSNICVSDMQLLTSEKKYTHIVNEYTKYDPTLPRINTIKCPNQECSSNNQAMAGGIGKKSKQSEAGPSEAGPSEAGPSEAAAAPSRKRAPSKKALSKKALEAANVENIIVQAEQQGQAEQQVQAEQQGQAEQQVQAEEVQAEQNTELNNREVIYIRYDDTNMKYVYLCAHCDTTWRTDNRI